MNSKITLKGEIKMKKRSVFKIIIELLKLIGSFIGVIMLAVIMGTVGFILAMNITIFAALAVIKFMGTEIALSFTILFVVIAGSGILRGIVRYFEQYFNHYIAFRLLAIIRGKIFEKLRELSPAKLDSKNKGEIISIIQSDIETLEVFYAHTVSPFLIALLTSLTVFLFIGFTTTWELALVAGISYIIVGGVIPVIYYKFNNKYGKDYRRDLGKFEEYYLDSIYGSHEVLATNNQESRLKSVSVMSRKLIDANKGLDNNSSLFRNVTNTIIVIMNVMIIIVGGYLLSINKIESPLIILAYVSLTSSFGSVIALASLPGNLAMTFASGNRVLDLLEEKPQVEDAKDSKSFIFDNLKIENVAFKYDNTQILNNINMTINKNEIVGILGPSGCGKSTLLKLLMRFYNVDKGSILYNGINIKNISIKHLYENVNLFSQSTYLFTGTIYDNLLIANPQATKEEVIEACKNASIYKYIESLPNGFETKITDLKDNLSSGEKQRLGLARVFLKKPKLLLLDEATSNIDAINESIILNALNKYKEDMTIIMISHRKSTLSICDKIYKLNCEGDE
jgi:ATP-binding cassette subfamily C protein